VGRRDYDKATRLPMGETEKRGILSLRVKSVDEDWRAKVVEH